MKKQRQQDMMMIIEERRSSNRVYYEQLVYERHELVHRPGAAILREVRLRLGLAVLGRVGWRARVKVTWPTHLWWDSSPAGALRRP